MAPEWLLCDQQALYVDGIGHIDQYGSYLKTLWEKGVVYFVRDYYFTEVELRLERGESAKSLRPLIDRLNTLNSKILEYEQCKRSRSLTHPKPSAS